MVRTEYYEKVILCKRNEGCEDNKRKKKKHLANTKHAHMRTHGK